VSYAIIGVGGFLGMGKHDVAIPVSHLKADGDRIIFPGATKNALKAMPKCTQARDSNWPKRRHSSADCVLIAAASAPGHWIN
jgi:hypothetical protein